MKNGYPWYLKLYFAHESFCIYGTEENLRSSYEEWKEKVSDVSVDEDRGIIEVHGYMDNAVRSDVALTVRVGEVRGMFLAEYW